MPRITLEDGGGGYGLESDGVLLLEHSCYQTEVLADSPTVVFPMGEAAGNLTDLIAAKVGTAVGTPTYAQAGPVVGFTAITMDATGDYFTVAGHADLDLADGPLTIEVWLRRITDTGNYERALSKGVDAYGVAIGGTAGGPTIADKLIFVKENIAILSQSTASVPADGTWHHYAITRSATRGAGSTIVYVDGTAGTANDNITQTLANTADALQIGRDALGGLPFLGGMAWVAFYKSVLSPARIAVHRAAASVFCDDAWHRRASVSLQAVNRASTY